MLGNRFIQEVQFKMQEGKLEDPEKIYGSKYGLGTKYTYGAGTGIEPGPIGA